MINNYETLGISTPGYVKEGIVPVAVTKVELFDQSASQRKNDVAIKVYYAPEGKGQTYNFILSGDYKRDEQGHIIAAGSAFTILEFFNAMGILCVNADGSINENVLSSISATPLSDNPLISEYEPNLYVYMYREVNRKDGKTYWRAYRRVLPITAKDSDIRKLVGHFEKDVKMGYIKPASTVQTPISEVEEL